MFVLSAKSKMLSRYVLRVVSLFFCSLLAAGSPCPPDWRQRGTICYLVNATSTLSWAGAAALCQEHNGSLVSITNRTKLLDVVDVLRGRQQEAAAAAAAAPVSVRRSGRVRRPPSRLVVAPSQSVYDSSSERVTGPSAETEPGTEPAASARTTAAGSVPAEWWIDIQITSGDVLTNHGSVFDNFGEEKISKEADQEHQCAFMAMADGLWYWRSCDSALNYICQKDAERVDIDLVTPDRRRPEPAWFAAHAARLEAALAVQQQNASDTDDKGTYNAAKVTMTPIPRPPTTTPMTTTSAAPTSAGLPPGALSTPSSATCNGQGWFSVGRQCHHLFLEAKTWDAALLFCTQQGGKLASFLTPDDQNAFIQRYGYNTGLVWIALRRLSPSDPSASLMAQAWLPPMGQFSWAPGQPVDGKYCGALALHTGLRSAEDCSTPRAFACSRAPDATPAPSSAAPATTAAPPAGPSAPECGAGDWWRYGDSCLLLVKNSTASWHEAQQACRRRSAALAKIDVYAKKSFTLTKLAGLDQVWIGLSKWNTPDLLYHWSDGSDASQAFWAGGHNESAELSSCVRMDGAHGYWTTANCNQRQPYLCEKPVSGAVQWPAAARPPLRSTCPPQWQPFGADRCLKLFTDLASHHTARQRCRQLAPDVDLLTVPSAVHQAFLTSAVRQSRHNVWLGLQYAHEQQQTYFTWLDEAPVNFTNWAPAQPSDPCATCPVTCGVADGGSSTTPGVWRDVDCGNLFSYVCQRPATPNNTINTREDLCQSPYHQYTAAGDACYKIMHEEVSWAEAADTCSRVEGAALAYVGDAFDNAELVKLLFRDGRPQYWLALSDTHRYGTMEWSSPWPPTPTFLNWDGAHGRAAVRSSCAALRPDTGLWWHQSCDQQRPFVCMHAPDRTAAALSDQGCPEQGRWFGSDSRCYQLFSGSGVDSTWDAAKQRCEKDGYRLADVRNIADFLAVKETLRQLSNSNYAWIGYHHDGQYFRWSDGSATNFTGWHQGEPSQSDGQCAEADALAGGHWRAADCSRPLPYICATEKTTGTPVTGAVTDAAGGPSGWTVFGVICLVAVLVVAAAGAALWYARRRRAAWLPPWVRIRSPAHHSVDNLAYDHHSDALATNRPAPAPGSLENGDMDRHLAQRWGSQEQLVADEDL